ncbi:LPXTG cell wall anchor domain-containing protein [Streptomyces phaeochromogenes]|uniref:LPXTG cell wall anchor domain-containing protein n=1 Tax=Streptomyces phaeochromogenes TaxID=1923 RepID=A0ABZ1HBA7_STRPH|nr:LPXTG cell wall anchor domain-containing protein [Streptomyces phaeochromogenes]MCX5601944.1 LPXTG cell wall anchor domain-containing protein [Streptomyces phaeochromogenes]WSD15455.1 LPXTG cell wall anchor domain-containing protein [Streptomyces phaeochromogenes]
MSARRSLLTATAAGTLLGALWFVPSANATGDGTAEHRTQTATTTTLQTKAGDEAKAEAEASEESAAEAAVRTQLADTGSFDTTPYVVGGTLFLSLGAGFVVYSVRRERTTVY